ncbi:MULTISPECIES: enoyl-CoA hydratase [Euryhalocaulis]|uniref:enoyl-CoA hydratase n=1 Tax=Euryhalocaulis TaxID=1712422 RepID=UPI0003AA498D|nr:MULTISPECIES: enoyl-CoA hydratase [Euryhalocaulis]MBA4802035.1 enoyl-CoA hydratase [Euryhalocaulis sp.]
MAFETIEVKTDGAVGVITLNRPKAMNALNDQLTTELAQALADFETNDDIGCVVLTGSKKAFAAGADIKELQGRDFVDLYKNDPFAKTWESVDRFRKPVIAAVSGYALGGGCEIAMMCDFIIASENARFGQPEITIGVMPGSGGTQRLPRFIGKAKAMDLCLTGRTMDAQEAERCGLVSRLVSDDDLMEEAMEAARKIAGFSRPITMMAKETVNQAYETTLSQGVRFERRVFHSMFSTEDQKEGMAAFAEKRAPHFKNR